MGQYFLNSYSLIQIFLNVILLSFQKEHGITLQIPFLKKTLQKEIGDNKIIQKQSLNSALIFLYIYASIAFTQTYFMNLANIFVYIPVFATFGQIKNQKLDRKIYYKIKDQKDQKIDLIADGNNEEKPEMKEKVSSFWLKHNIQNNGYYVFLLIGLTFLSIFQIMDMQQEGFSQSIKGNFNYLKFDLNKIRNQAQKQVEGFVNFKRVKQIK